VEAAQPSGHLRLKSLGDDMFFLPNAPHIRLAMERSGIASDAPLKKWTSIYRYTSAVRIQLENNIPVLSVTFFCCKNG